MAQKHLREQSLIATRENVNCAVGGVEVVKSAKAVNKKEAVMKVENEERFKNLMAQAEAAITAIETARDQLYKATEGLKELLGDEDDVDDAISNAVDYFNDGLEELRQIAV